MSLKLRVKQGLRIGAEIEITDGLEISRESALFPLGDNKISGHHGVFRLEADGRWSFIDLGSKNGTFLGTERVDRVPLESGVNFRVGDTILEVLGEVKEAENKKTWAQILEDAFEKAQRSLEDKEETLTPFFRPLKMEVLSGPQIDTSWIVAFGPRFVGQGSEDFPIYLDGAPEICFEVAPHSQGVKIINHAEHYVFYNDSRFREQNVLPGDRLKLGSMEILLEFL